MSRCQSGLTASLSFRSRWNYIRILLARLRGTPTRLDDVLVGRSRNILIRKPEGKWSAQEHAGHLLDLEPLWLARVEDYVAGSNQLSVDRLARIEKPTKLTTTRSHWKRS